MTDEPARQVFHGKHIIVSQLNYPIVLSSGAMNFCYSLALAPEEVRGHLIIAIPIPIPIKIKAKV